MTIALNILIKNDIENIKKVFETYLTFFDKIYVLNHNSNDGVIAFIENLAEKVSCASKLEISHYKNESIHFAEARNELLAKTNEDFVMWLDSDDEIDLESLCKIKRELLKNQDTDGLIIPYWYTYSEENPTIIQYRERVLKTPKDWVWQNSIHETCQSKAPGKNLSVFSDVKILHNKGKFESKKESSVERNLRLLLALETPTFSEIYYLIRETAGALGYLGVKPVFEKYREAIEFKIKDDNPVLHELILQHYLESAIKYYKKTKFDSSELDRLLSYYSSALGSRLYSDNKSLSIFIEGVSELEDTRYAENYLSKLYYIRKYAHAPSETSRYFLETKYYYGYGELEESKYWFSIGLINQALTALMRCQSTYYPTDDFVEHYQKVKNYCLLNDYTIAVVEDGAEVGPELLEFDLVLTLPKDVIQKCDISEFTKSTLYVVFVAKSSYRNFLVNSNITTYYSWCVDDSFSLPWIERSTNYDYNFKNWRLVYSNPESVINLFTNTDSQEMEDLKITTSKPTVLLDEKTMKHVVGLSGVTSKFLKSFQIDEAEKVVKIHGDVLFKPTSKLPREPFTFKYLPNAPKRTVFIVASGNESWSGLSPHTTGIGASETSAINLAEQLRSDYRVVVFCPIQESTIVHGVSYLPLTEWSPALVKKTDIIIASRMPEVLNTRICDCQILWLHDDPESYYRSLLEKERAIDFYVCVSKTQLKKLKKYTNNIIEDSKLKYIYNIVRLSPRCKTTRVKDRTVFLSSPQRSTLNLRNYRHNLKPESCYVFYGWQGYQGHDRVKAALIEKFTLRSLKYNVVGRIPKLPLHKFLQSCEYMPYFSDFFETFCSAAAEAIYYGVKLVTNNDSALLEIASLMQKRFKKTNFVEKDVQNLTSIFQTATAPKNAKNQFGTELVLEWIDLFNYSEGNSS